MRGRRALCVLTIAAVVSLGIMGAISVIPHAHGKDRDNTAHGSCPICQFTAQGLSAATVAFNEVIAIFFALFFLVSISTLCDNISYQIIPARGPPALI